ncbi:MAG TPA: amidohydrolase family protein [Fimbriimonadaceae bacterium]|jgi:hypothetical protein
MRIITLEEHFVSPMYLEVTAQFGFGALNPAMADILRKQKDLGEERLKDMDEGGVSLQVLSLSGILLDRVDPATATAIVRDSNEIAAKAVREHPTRFAAFAALGMAEPEKAADELKRCVQEYGFVGAMIDGTCKGLFYDDERFLPVFKAAVELNVPIYLHPAPPPQAVQEAYYSKLPNSLGQTLSIAGWGWHVETGLHVLRLIVSGLFDKLPDLRIIIGHMGENLPFSIMRADAVLSRQANLSKSVAEFFKSNFYVTTSGYFTLPPFQCALEVCGVDHLLFSVDYPFSANTKGKAFLDSLPVSAEDKEKIAHGNAERVLGIRP